MKTDTKGEVCRREITIMLDVKTTITELDQQYKDAEFWFRSAELDVVDGTYFPTDPTKTKIPDNVRVHNRRIKQSNFISAKRKITNIKNDYLNKIELIISQIEFEERKRLMTNRYKIEKMIKACNHYIEIFSD